MKPWKLTLGALLLSTVSSLSTQVLAAEITAAHIKARASIPGTSNSAAFMQLHNHAKQSVRLIAAESGVSKVVELHTHLNIDGKMAMRQLEYIELPAESVTELKPGGLHVMLIGLYQPLKEGEEIELTLIFDDGTRQVITAPVKHIMNKMQH